MSENEGLGTDRPSVATPDIADLDDLTLIGRGGFCRVYAALDIEFGRRVAVKVFPPQDDTGLRRIERERLLMGRMSMHPNVVTPHRFGVTESGLGYLVMEYLPGGSLDQLVARSGPVQWPEAVELTGPILDALEAAHDLGIVHRDIKPANILLTAEGETKLTDFGIAQIRSASEEDSAFSLAYCAPEAFGDGTDRRDERSDLYSLAATLFHLVTGRGPFEVDGDDSTPAYLRRIELNAVPPVGSLVLEAFFRRALAKDPDDRPQTVAEFRSAMLVAAGRPDGAEVAVDGSESQGSEPETGAGAASNGHGLRPILSESERPESDPVEIDLDRGQTPDHPATTGHRQALPSVSREPDEPSGRRLRLVLAGLAAAFVAAILGLGFALGPSFWPGDDGDETADGPSTDGDDAIDDETVEERAADDQATDDQATDEGAADESASNDDAVVDQVADDEDADADVGVRVDPARSEAAGPSVTRSSTGDSTTRSTTTNSPSSTTAGNGSTADASSSSTTASTGRTTAPTGLTSDPPVRSSTTVGPSSPPTSAAGSTTRPSITATTARPTTTVDRADEAFQDGVAAFNAGRVDESIEHLDRAATLDPDHPEVFIYRSLAHRVQGRFGQAVADGDRAVENDPNNGDAYLQRGIALAADGRPTAALADLNRADRLKPRSVVVLLNRGVVNADLGNLTAARSDFDTIITLDPSNADAHWHRGRLNGRVGRNDEALADLETFVNLASPSDGRLPEARRLIDELRGGNDPFDQV